MAFGDHQPAVESEYLDTLYTLEDSPYEMFTTPYFLWPNYPLPPQVKRETLSSTYLASTLVEASSLPRTGYQSLSMRVYSIAGAQDRAGYTYSSEDSLIQFMGYQLHMVQYNYLYDAKHYPSDFYTLKE